MGFEERDDGSGWDDATGAASHTDWDRNGAGSAELSCVKGAVGAGGFRAGVAERGPPQVDWGARAGPAFRGLRGGGSARLSWAALLLQLPSSKETFTGCPVGEVDGPAKRPQPGLSHLRTVELKTSGCDDVCRPPQLSLSQGPQPPPSHAQRS